jgi:hypothetical protein
MAAANYNLTIEQGISFEIEFTLKDNVGTALDISSYTFKGEVRNSTDQFSTAVGTFAFTITNGSLGIVKMKMTAANTANIPQLPTLHWDLIAQDANNDVFRYLEGSVAVVDTVTSTTF